MRFFSLMVSGGGAKNIVPGDFAGGRVLPTPPHAAASPPLGVVNKKYPERLSSSHY